MSSHFHHKLGDNGQTVVALLIFMMLAISLSTAAIAITAINTRANSSFIAGEQAKQNAEIGIEDSLQQLLRNPNYAGGTMTLTDGTATITISGVGTKTIVSQGISGELRRTITVTATIANNTLTVNTWNETP